VRSMGLKAKSILVIICIYIVIGTAALGSLVFATRDIAENLGASVATKQALWHRDRLAAAITREMILARKLADSALIKKWFLDESDVEAKAMAMQELESFRRFFKEHAYFAAPAASGHYYFYDDSKSHPPDVPLATMTRDRVEDAWFWTTLAASDELHLNVDWDRAILATKVWINVQVRDNGKTIGAIGSGLDLTGFLKEFVESTEPGVSSMLLGRSGAIQAHQDSTFIDFNSLSKAEADRRTIYQLLDNPRDRDNLRSRLDKLAAGNGEVEILFLELHGDRQLAAISYLPEIQWFTMTLLDVDEVIGFASFSPLAILIVTSLLIIIVLISIFLNRIILKPLLRLTQSTQQIAAGRYEISLPVDREDEIGGLTHSFNHMADMVRDYMRTMETKIRERTEALFQANQKLEDTNRKLLDSINYARLIQTAILPDRSNMAARLGDLMVIWRPRDVVGGDFYHFTETRDGGFVIAVADCTGHGVPGAFMTMSAHAVIGHAVALHPEADPATLLGITNRLMRDMVHRAESMTAADNGLDLAICRIDPDHRKLTFAGGRIPLVYVQDGRLIEVKGDPHSLGYRRSRPNYAFTNHFIDIMPEQRFYLSSDGLLDQAGGRKGLGFGRKRYHEMIIEAQDLSLADQATYFESVVAEYRGPLPQRDDMTMIGFSVVPTRNQAGAVPMLQGDVHA
jgi:sigma-B regulation protein RsbU (phosphoserine phosphatase)